MQHKKLKLHPMQQAHVESCLASCLSTLVQGIKGIGLTAEEEKKLLMDGSNVYRIDFAIGQLIFIAQHHKLKVELLIDFKPYVDHLRKEKFPKSLKIKHLKINEISIKRLVKESPIIIYVDKFHLISKQDMLNRYHYPHYIIVSRFDKKVTILDPWDGQEKELTKKQFMKAVQDLKKRIGLSPRIIRIV